MEFPAPPPRQQALDVQRPWQAPQYEPSTRARRLHELLDNRRLYSCVVDEIEQLRAVGML
jgi:hypothetical protein